MDWTIEKLHGELRTGKVSAKKVTEEYFNRIQKTDKGSKIYLKLNKEEAIEKAKEVDKKIKKGEKIGKLEGIPVSVKDVICTQNLETTAASKVLKGYKPPYDATVVKKLKEVNSVILGKVNCDEFAMGGSGENSAYGVCPNPHDKTRVPGGSSSGSAVSVASNLAVYSIGSDTGGSVRLPAAFNGIVGLKPTYGRVSRYGLIAMASSLDQIGVLAKNISDSAEVLKAIVGNDKHDSTSTGVNNKDFKRDFKLGMKGLTIGYCKKFINQSDEATKEYSWKYLEKWKKEGGKIKEIDLPFSGEEAVACYYLTMTSEASSNMARYDGVRFGKTNKKLRNNSKDWQDYVSRFRTELLGKEVKRRIVLGTFSLSAGYYDAYYGKAQKVRSYIQKSLERIHKKVPLIFTPTSPDLPFKIGDKIDDPVRMYLVDIFTTPASLAGIPAISFPIGKEDNLPVGAQLMAASWDEETMLRGAYWSEKIMK